MRDDDRADKRQVAPDDRERKRRPYAKPIVREYGSIAKLTQSGGSTKNEPGGGMRGCL